MAIRFIGCGTAKCGSTSLYHLIKDCGVNVKHERHLLGHELPWQYNRDAIASKIKHFNSVRGDYGEIAFYFLPYVPKMMADILDLKVICLRRKMEDTVRSFKNTIVDGENPWRETKGWGKCYPKYNDDLNECIHEWWRTYYEIAEAYNKLFDNFLLLETEELNSHNGQKKIFDFLRLPIYNYKPNCRFNVSI